MQKKGQVLIGVGVVAIIGLLTLMTLAVTGVIKLPSSQQSAEGAVKGAVNVAGTTQLCPTNPTFAYAGVDVFSKDAISGTGLTKQDTDEIATATTTPSPGKSLKYWLQNTTGAMCDVKEYGKVGCSNDNVQTKCYTNSTPTISMKYPLGNSVLTNNGGANNVTMTTSTTYDFELTYKGIANHPFMPFGGCVAIEIPSSETITSLNGGGISSNVPCAYAWNGYTGNSTGHTTYKFAVPADFDTGDGVTKVIYMTLQTGSTDPAATPFAVTFQPAYWYSAKSGDFVKEIERTSFSGDTTKTYGNGTLVRYFQD